MILAITNRKGGVGKTTTTTNLASAFARAQELSVDRTKNYRVLVVDMDSQGNASKILGAVPEPGDLTIADIVIDGVDIREVIAPSSTPGLNIVPANDDIESRLPDLIQVNGTDDRNEQIRIRTARENRLAAALATVRDQYDIILIDCPPSIGMQWRMAMRAADNYLMPLDTDDLGLEGVRRMFAHVRTVDTGDLAPLLGLVLVMMDYRLQDARPTERALREQLGEHVFTNVVRTNHALDTAHRKDRSIYDHNARASGAQDYRRVAQELLERARKLDLIRQPTATTADVAAFA